MLEGLEKEAREGRKGLWADPQPVPPWEWRKRTGERSIADESAAVGEENHLPVILPARLRCGKRFVRISHGLLSGIPLNVAAS